MKRLTLIFLSISISFVVHAKSPEIKESKTDSLLSAILDRIDSQEDLENIYLIQTDSLEESNNNNYMIWLVALIVGILTIITNMISNRFHRKSNKDIAKVHLESNEKGILKTIESSKIIALQEIQNSNEIIQTEFKITFNTKNRQAWIDEIRNSLSTLISDATCFIAYNKPESRKSLENLLEKMIFEKVKLLLLLNSGNTEHKDLITHLENFTKNLSKKNETTDSDRTSLNNLLAVGQQFLFSQSEKIENLE